MPIDREFDEAWRRGKRSDDEPAWEDSDDDDGDDEETEDDLPTCPECNAKIFDDDVSTCPYCGVYIIRGDLIRGQPIWVIAIVVLLALALSGIFIFL